ncbi:50S ribosomal protein L4 [Candidatus Micrarchaeota archaeon]|nr:50S ribosomal protein L4 [Candidatus Micrarchaeota archaeon]
MEASTYSLDGRQQKRTVLPRVFSEPVREDLIRRASLAVLSQGFQPKGVYKWSGLETSAEYVGRRRSYRSMINIGRARLPKVKLPKGRMGDVRKVPFARKGRRAHPPKPEHVLVEKINKRERRKAVRSAIAATGVKELALARGHRIPANATVPFVVEDGIESVKKAGELFAALERLGLGSELERCRETKIRAGRGKSRGRKYRKKRGILIIVSKDGGIMRAASAIPGVEACTVNALNVDMLAPGGTPGRLALYSESALNQLDAHTGD